MVCPICPVESEKYSKLIPQDVIEDHRLSKMSVENF